MPHIKCNDVQLYYEMKGNGPPLVLINGLGCDMRILPLLVSELTPSCTVIAFDMRGAGQSDKPHEPYTIAQIAQDTVALIDQLCGGSAHVMGFSMGGCVAQEMALRHSDSVTSLTLLSTLPAWDKPHPLSNKAKELLAQTDVTEDLLEKLYDVIYGPAFKECLPLSEFIKFRLNDPLPQPAYSYLNQLHAVEQFDVYNDVTTITTPTLIVAGNSDQLVPPDNARWLHETIPGSKLHIIENVGHIVPLEAPKELAECLLAHIQHT